jgi:adenylate cyclase
MGTSEVEELSPELQELGSAAASFGFVNFHLDAEAFLRHQPQFIEWGGRLYPSLDLQMLKRYTNSSSVTVTKQDGRIESVQVGDYTIPTDRFGRYMVNFNGPSIFRDKIVIVGPHAIGFGDVVPTPFDPVLPGVELHANVIDNIISQRYLVRSTMTTMVDLGLILVFGFAVALYMPKMGATRSIFYASLTFLQFRWVLSSGLVRAWKPSPV